MYNIYLKYCKKSIHWSGFSLKKQKIQKITDNTKRVEMHISCPIAQCLKYPLTKIPVT